MHSIWLILSAILVFIIQAGLLCIEAGLVRSKNSIHVAAKNISDFIIAASIFWLIGYGLIYGTSFHGLIGTSQFLFEPGSGSNVAFFLFQMMFCGTAATIVSGAVAERIHYNSYIIITIIISLLIYPVIAHWVWHGNLDNQTLGWLKQTGFIDFAGASVVHSTGGWVALAALLIIGPRAGRFGEGGAYIIGSNLPLASLGCLLIIFGWFGFTGGSVLSWNETVPHILLNTLLSGVWSGAGVILIHYTYYRFVDLPIVINGVIGGLVSITASCHLVTTLEAVIIGGIAAVIVTVGRRSLEYLQIDDAVGVIPVHLLCGIWGTLAVAVFADLPADISRWQQMQSQLIGVIVIAVYSFGIAYCLLKFINHWYRLRVNSQSEKLGLNIVEHHISTEIYDLFSKIREQDEMEVSSTLCMDTSSEVGQIAERYNRIVEKMYENEKQIGALLDAAMDCIVTVDQEGKIVSFNRSAEQCFGVEKNVVIAKSFFHEFAGQRECKKYLDSVKNGFTQNGGILLNRRNTVFLRRQNHEQFDVELLVIPIRGQKLNQRYYTFYIRDTSHLHNLEKRIQELSHQDSLTGLNNRNYLITQLRARIALHKRSNSNVALFLFGLNQFHRLNNSLGNELGDQFLHEVADKLRRIIRHNDVLCRWDGDEFMLLISGELSPSTIKNRAQEALLALKNFPSIDNEKCGVSCSIGIALSIKGECNAAELIQYAEIALTESKKEGNYSYSIYNSAMGTAVKNKFRIESSFLDALKNNELQLYYQPKICCKTGALKGFEALLRWYHPRLGLIMPDAFIPIIEGSPKIIDLGEWVIEQVARQIVEWQKRNKVICPIALNISGEHFHSEKLLSCIQRVMSKYGVSGRYFEIEITESVLTSNTLDSLAIMQALKDAELRLSIDDFGTGYSSLSYLKSFPVDTLKIDKVFVRESHKNKEDAAICQAVITLAKSLNLNVVAEGVELQEQLALLTAQGCDVYQGFYYSPAIEAEEAEKQLKTKRGK